MHSSTRARILLRLAIPVLIAAGLAGCGTAYVTPGAAAPLETLGHSEIAAGSARQPSPAFPASLAVVRAQAAPYRSATAEGYGAGSYTVLAADAGTQATVSAIAAWPAVEQATYLDTTALSPRLDDLGALRGAAARTQADVLLVYTLATAFSVRGEDVKAGADVAIGAKQGGPASVAVAATAVFVDVRTGFVYGSAHGNSVVDASQSLQDSHALEAKRVEAESGALAALLKDAGTVWATLLQQYR